MKTINKKIFLISLAIIVLILLIFVLQQLKKPITLDGDKNVQYNNWQTYRNKELGFEIEYPKEIYNSNGACELRDGKYIGIGGMVPVKMKQVDNTVSVLPEYYYEDGTSDCNKNYDLLPPLLYEPSWKIIVKDNINSEEKLANLVREFYGDKCKIGEKIQGTQEGVFDIKLYWDGKDLEHTECINNYASVFKYYPEKNKVAAWYIGSEYVLWGNEEGTITFDQAMIDSFKFIDSPR